MEIFLRILLLTATSLCGYLVFKGLFSSNILNLLGIFCGLGTGFLVIKLERKLFDVPLKEIIGGFVGILAGLIIVNFFVSELFVNLAKDISIPLYVFSYFTAGYLGLRIGAKKTSKLDLSKVPLFEGLSDSGDVKIVDTSAIIDGRIADICEAGFIEGMLVIPQFVLYEIQHIADHQDPVKRARGRRGLDILHRLQKQNFVKVKIVEYDFPKLKDVDSKLVALAKKLNGKLITNDFNLNKVAELQGIEVLNINQLSTALRPSVLPGEQMSLRILKEGKEHKQGIGYLDDGTMVVVDDAKRMLGKQVDVVVTSLLQTTSGRMIFAKLKEDAEREFYFPEDIKYEEQGVR